MTFWFKITRVCFLVYCGLVVCCHDSTYFFYIPRLDNLKFAFFCVVFLSLILYSITKFYTTNIKLFDSALESYECGFSPFDDATRQPFDVHYYIVGLLFLIFDVEVALIVPWIVDVNGISSFGSFCGVFLFLFIITAGFFYEWYVGALKWPRVVAQPFFDKNVYFRYKKNIFSVVVLLQNNNYNLANITPFLVHYHTEILIIFCMCFSICQLIYFRSKRSRIQNVFFTMSNQNVTLNQANMNKLIFRELVGVEEIIVSRKLHKMFFGLIISINTFVFFCFVFDWLPLHAVNYFEYSPSFVSASHYVQIDSMSIEFIALVLLVLTYVLIDVGNVFLKLDKKNSVCEYYFYMLGALFFLVILIKSVHFLPVFLSFVGFGISSYLILSLIPLANPTDELMLKYFTISVFISMFLAFGLFLITIAFGNADITFLEMGEIFRIVQTYPEIYQKQINFVPLYITWISLSFLAKLNIAPFHWWVSDIYKKLDYATLFFFAVILKIALCVSFFKIYFYIFQYSNHNFQLLLFNCFFCCLFFGSILTLFEKNLKKFIGFSSVNQLGFIFILGVTSKLDSFYAIVIYLIVYFIITILLFILLMTTAVEKTSSAWLQNQDELFINQMKHKFCVSFEFVNLDPAPTNPRHNINDWIQNFNKNLNLNGKSFSSVSSTLLFDKKNFQELEYITDLKLSTTINKEYGYFMQVLFLFMTGLPPFFSFLPKFSILLIQQFETNYDLVIYAFVFTLISIFYYICIVLYVATDDFSVILQKSCNTLRRQKYVIITQKEKLISMLPNFYIKIVCVTWIIFFGWAFMQFADVPADASTWIIDTIRWIIDVIRSIIDEIIYAKNWILTNKPFCPCSSKTTNG